MDGWINKLYASYLQSLLAVSDGCGDLAVSLIGQLRGK